jgi:hypothetical protein
VSTGRSPANAPGLNGIDAERTEATMTTEASHIDAALPRTEAARDMSRALPIDAPEGRRLKVYAFDPSVSTEMDTSLINQAVLTVPWENDLKPGPVGEYIEVVDVDPASGCAYLPVDLDHPYLLARGGLDPSEGNPQFHQQMVYAVTMKTLRNFEQALGRPALWSPRQVEKTDGTVTEEYVRRLRIYPHAIRTTNAYYSPEKKALLFGYFPASRDDAGKHYPGGLVFSCLSHDIVAHETAHALLDGMHRRFVEPSNEDVLALHEAFADIVAIFQRFSMSEVLQHQIARTRGDLANHQHLMSQLAMQFGRAIGAKGGALRNALGQGELDPKTGRWKPLPPDPTELGRTPDPHARGAILVAAVFDAFLAIYKSRIEEITRIATKGSGILPEGEIAPDLVSCMAAEASKAAQHVLNMCIRAMDYLPAVDVTFGDYLRALITADTDLVPNDSRQYRLAFLAAFRGRGIYPRDIRSLSVDTLRWRSPQDMGEVSEALAFGRKLSGQLQGFANEWRLTGRSYESHDAAGKFILAMGSVTGTGSDEGPNLSGTYREAVFLKSRRMRQELHKWLMEIPDDAKNSLLGLDLGPGPTGTAAFEVHAVRPVRRVGPDDRIILQMIIEITQNRPEWVYPSRTRDADALPDFHFQGGATLIVDLETGAIKYIIRKPINDPARLKRHRDFVIGPSSKEDGAETDHIAALRMTYFGRAEENREPFAMLHRSAPGVWEDE